MGWTQEFLEDNKNHFTVYMHVNKINDKKYIGITGREPKERWHGGNGYCRNKHFYDSIQKYGWNNFDHVIIAENLSKEFAIEMEKVLIAQYDTTNRDKGYNIGFGGEGIESLSEETIEKIRKANTGRKLSEETKKKISESRKGDKNWKYSKKLPDWHKEILIKAITGRVHTQEEIDKVIDKRGYITFQYDLNGIYLNSYRSANEAAKSLGIGCSGVRACCEKRLKTNHEFIFRYKKDGYLEGENLSQEDVDFANHTKNKFKIYQCDLFENIIKEYANCTEAGRELHIDRHDISKCLKGERETAGGFKWKKVS